MQVDYSQWIVLNNALRKMGSMASTTDRQKRALSLMLSHIHRVLNTSIVTEDAAAAILACRAEFPAGTQQRDAIEDLLKKYRLVLRDITKRVQHYRCYDPGSSSSAIARIQREIDEFETWWKAQSIHARSHTLSTINSNLSARALAFSGTWANKNGPDLVKQLLQEMRDLIEIYKSHRQNSLFFRYKMSRVTAGAEIMANRMLTDAAMYERLFKAWKTYNIFIEACLAS